MKLVLESIRLTKKSTTAPEYSTRFRSGDRVFHYHAIVSTSGVGAIRFRETAFDDLLCLNIAEGRKVYLAVDAAFRGEPVPLPMTITLRPLIRKESPTRRVMATGRSA